MHCIPQYTMLDVSCIKMNDDDKENTQETKVLHLYVSMYYNSTSVSIVKSMTIQQVHWLCISEYTSEQKENILTR